jgi:poly(ADP-ribose) glycohydrolase ARH3
VAQASAVGSSIAHALQERTINPSSFVKALAELVRPISDAFGQRLRQLETIAPDGTEALIDALTECYECNIKAIEAVPPAIGAFLYTDNFRDAVVTAVSLGGDTDTIGAMAGAVAGAYYGYRQIPMEWLDKMENGDKGRDYVAKLAREAAERLIINKKKE